MRFRQHQDAARQATTRLLMAFAAVVIGLVVAVNAALALLWWLAMPFASALPNHFVVTNTALVLLYVLGGCWVETSRLAAGGAAVARLTGAREAQPGRGNPLSRLEQRLVNVVQELSVASGHRPVPAAWVLVRDDTINALACGWDGEDAVVVVTRGALERLTRAELQGVVAHEFSHLAHGDARLNLRLAGMVWGLQLIWTLGESMMAPNAHGQRRAVFLIGLALRLVGTLGWLAGRVLQAAVSRQREFLADASAVKYTRDVEGLGGALRKLLDQQRQGRAALVDAPSGSLEHLMFSATSRAGRWHRWLATHPTLDERVARLYGQPMEPLDNRPQPAPPVDEPVHPALVALQGSRAAAVIGANVPSRSEGVMHDPLQQPAHHDAAAREAEALARLARWHGAGEWQAALLALSLPDDTEAVWTRATADLPVAAAVRSEIQALRAPAQRHARLALLVHARSWPTAVRRARRNELFRKRWPHGPDTPARRWQAFVVDRGLRAVAPVPGRPGFDPWAAVEAATVWLTPALEVPAAQAQAWQDAALAGLAPFEAMRARPQRGLAPAHRTTTWRCALRVRWLPPMQRPWLLRAWLQAAQATEVLAIDSAIEALQLACHALELPLPDALR